MDISLATLLTPITKTKFYERALLIAQQLGLPVTSWQPGDPTRSLYHIESELLESMEGGRIGFLSSGFLGLATGAWKAVCAKQIYNVDVPAATFATTKVVLTNTGDRYFPDIVAGELTLRASSTGKTYHNTTGGTLNVGPGTTLEIEVEADEAGSESTAAAGEIDEIVTTMIGVTCTNPTVAIGLDEQDEATTEKQCLDKLDSFSPNGPRGAYTYVARNSALTGTRNILDARTFSDSETGDVTLYLKGPSGAVAEADRALVEAAVVQYATPLCVTPTVLSAAAVPVAVTYELWVYRSVNRTADEVRADVLAALNAMVASHPIGGDIISEGSPGKLYASLVESTIRSVYKTNGASRDPVFRISMSAPSADVSLTQGQVITLGAVTGTITFVEDP